MLSCPKCGSVLTQKTVSTAGSGSIEVDFCESCGGVYFDRGEINRISQGEVTKLGHIKTHNTSHQGTNRCPKCGASLERYWGEAVPSDVYVLRCPDCSGTWFSHQDLKKFKTAQEHKINYFRTWKIPLSSLSSVLIPIALFVVLTGSTLIVVEQIKNTQDSRIFAQDILTTPSVVAADNRTTATIIFTTKVKAESDIVISGLIGPDDITVLPVSAQPKTAHRVTIRNLLPGKRYAYRIHILTGEDSIYSDEFSFSL